MGFFHLLAVASCLLGVYKDLFDRKQGIFKSDAVNPLSGAGLTLPVFLVWVPVVSLTLFCLFPTSLPCPPRPSLDVLTPFPLPWMLFTWLMGEAPGL